MLKYRAASWLIDTAMPEVKLGITKEELLDEIPSAQGNGSLAPSNRAAAVESILTQGDLDQVEKDAASSNGQDEQEQPLTDEEKSLPSNPPTAEEVARVEAGEPVNEPAADTQTRIIPETITLGGLKADLDKTSPNGLALAPACRGSHAP